jgi:hypothetical protein
MQDTLITFETSKLAKEKGFFDKNIYGEVRLSQYNFYDDNGVLRKIDEAFELTKDFDLKNCCNAPTQSLLQKWLREAYNIHLLIEPYYNEHKVLVYGFDLLTESTKEEILREKGFKTYEEALEVGLQEALKLV